MTSCLCLQLDAKRSPLALLAQTCNSIGKDISTCPQIYLRTSSVTFCSKDSGRSGAKDTTQKDQETTKSEENPERCSSSRVEPSSGEDDQRTGQTVPPTGVTFGIPTTSSGKTVSGDPQHHHRSGALGQRKQSPKEKCSSAPGHHHHHHRSRRLTLTPTREAKDAEQRTPLSPCKATSSESEEGAKSSRRPKSALHPPPTASPVSAPGELSRLKTASCSPSFVGDCLRPVASGCPSQYFTHQHLFSSIDSLSRVPSLPGLASYLSYLQTLGRETSSCKDPFCTECPHPMTQLPGGLIEKCLSSTVSHLGLSRPPYLGLSLHERPYPQGALDAPSTLHSGSVVVGPSLFPPLIPPPSPWACPWVSSGGDYCTERCYSAEELLVHKRTHWPSVRMGTLPCFSLSPHGFHSLPGFLGYSPHYALGPSFCSTSLLGQAYRSQGTPHGNGMLTVGSSAARFHPYKSPTSSRGLSSPTPLFEL